MEYSIFKEDTTEHTVKKIKNILKELKIETQEIIFPTNIAPDSKQYQAIPVVSLTVKITKPQFNFSVNGKGTCLNNAKASGYAELMERLQNFTNTSFLPSRLYVDRKEFKNSSFTENNKALEDFFSEKLKVKEFCKNIKEHTFLPFFNIKDKKVYYLPYDIIYFSQGSNGMSAGNTTEEALVQGLSEVCERYAIKEIFRKKLSLPDIPREKYENYDKIRKAIEYYEENGFKLYIKDASLGGKLPVVCTVFIKDNVMGCIFGSQPSLPIAIERTLTEFAQGQNVSEFSDRLASFPFYSAVKYENCTPEDIIHTVTHTKFVAEVNDDLKKMFLNSKNSYKYSDKAFIKTYDTNNKKLLKFLIDRIKTSVTSEIFIRDVSFLGFPSIYIFVPEMTQVRPYTKEFCHNHQKFTDWLNYDKKADNPKKYNVDTLFDVASLHTFAHVFWSTYASHFDAPFEYIAFLCAVLKKDYSNIHKFKEVIIAQNNFRHIFSDEQIRIFEMMHDYCMLLKSTKNEEDIRKKLEKKYKKSEIKSTIKMVKELTFDDIKDISLARKRKGQLHLTRFIDRLLKYQAKSMPKQEDLAKYFS